MKVDIEYRKRRISTLRDTVELFIRSAEGTDIKKTLELGVTIIADTEKVVEAVCGVVKP